MKKSAFIIQIPEKLMSLKRMPIAFTALENSLKMQEGRNGYSAHYVSLGPIVRVPTQKS